MAHGTLLGFVLVLNLVGTTLGTHCAQSVEIFSNDEFIAVHNRSPCAASVIKIGGQTIVVPPLARVQKSLRKVVKRSTAYASDTQGRSATSEALQETGKLLRLATMLPAETLQVLRMIAVPLLDTTLGAPANLLEGVASISIGKNDQGAKDVTKISEEAAKTIGDNIQEIKKQAKSYSGDLLKSLALPHHKSFFVHKKINFGPFSLSKVIQFGKQKHDAPVSPPTVVVATTEPPVAVEITTPPPVAVVPEVPAPAPPVVAATTEPPAAVEITTPPVAVVPEVPAPAPPVVAPVVAAPGSGAVVTVCQPTNVDSTAQVAIVHNASPAIDNSNSGDGI